MEPNFVDECHDPGIDLAESDTETIDISSPEYRRSDLSEEENRRTYNTHGLRSNAYPFPIDEIEEDLQHYYHMILQAANKDRLHLAPIKKAPGACLDIGTGMGFWLMDFAEKNPMIKCDGIDFILVQPLYVPPNLEFIIDDVNRDWRSTKYDLVYARNLRGSVIEKHIVQESYRCLQPGGFFERTEILPWDIQFHSNTRPDAVLYWCELMRSVMSDRDQDMNDLETYQSTMQEAGFTNVEIKTAMLPFGSWSNDILDTKESKLHMEVVLESLDGLSMALFIRKLGWHPFQVIAFLAEVKIGLKTPSALPYMTMRVIYGQKPA